jgi:hypothetical protein
MLSVIEYDCSAHGLTEQADIHRPRWRHSTRSSPWGDPRFSLERVPRTVCSIGQAVPLVGASANPRHVAPESCCLADGWQSHLLGLRDWHTSGLVGGIAPEWILPGRSNALWQHKLNVSAGGRPAPFHHSVMVHIARSWVRLSAPSTHQVPPGRLPYLKRPAKLMSEL